MDYDGSQTNFESSMNYTLEEYANDVVYHIQSVCDEAGVAHPTIVSESGRAIVAYHSVLVFNVLGVSGFGDEKVPTTANPDWEQPLVDLIETYNNVTARNALEAFHDAQQALDMALSLFSGGYLTLEQRSMAENLFWAICTKLQRIAQTMAEVPEDLQNLDEQLSDTYFCNFSLFQSIPDSWAIKQLFPVMPIHRLGEKPTKHAVLGDITCDSDGKLDRFVDRRDVKKTLPLHTVNGEPYYMGVFLVGAYQEILGDLHNLLGDTHAVHVSLDANGEARLDTLIKGDTVREVLDYVEFDAEMLLGKLRTDVETAVREGRVDYEGAGRLLRFYEDGLHGYTYWKGDRSRRSNDPNALLLLSLIEESPTGALEPLVERAGNGGWYGSQTHPLRLRAPNFLLGGAPSRLLFLDGAAPTLDRIGSQALSQLLCEPFSRRHLDDGLAGREQLLDSREQLFHSSPRDIRIDVGPAERRRPNLHQTRERPVILDRELLLHVSRKLRRRLPPPTRVLHDHTEAIRRGAGAARVGRAGGIPAPE